MNGNDVSMMTSHQPSLVKRANVVDNHRRGSKHPMRIATSNGIDHRRDSKNPMRIATLIGIDHRIDRSKMMDKKSLAKRIAFDPNCASSATDKENSNNRAKRSALVLVVEPYELLHQQCMNIANANSLSGFLRRNVEDRFPDRREQLPD